MKSNRELGYEPLYGEARKQLGAEKSWENDYTYVSTLSLHVTIGRRGAEYRVYGYTYHNEQDASREGIRGECCGRAKTPEEAMSQFRKNAASLGWHMQGVDKVLLDMRESLVDECVID